MIGERDIQELAAYEPGETPVVSLYLNVDPTQRTTEAYKLRLRGLLKNAVRPELAEDLSAIEKYIEHQYDWSGRGVVLFSNQSEGLWKTFPIAVPLSSSRLEVGRRPFIRPLVHLLDTYGNYGVVLVDRQGARFYHVHMGQLLDSKGYLGEDIHRLKKGGGSSRGGEFGGQPERRPGWLSARAGTGDSEFAGCDGDDNSLL